MAALRQAEAAVLLEVGEASIFAFAGLWDRWNGPNGNITESCTILTTAANQVLEDVHDRMPVILALSFLRSNLLRLVLTDRLVLCIGFTRPCTTVLQAPANVTDSRRR